MEFNPMNFVSNLKYMGIGLIGVFVIIGIIIAATYITTKLTTPKNKDDN